MTKILFDAHTHLDFEEYTEEERNALAEEIAASNVRYIIDVGDNVSSSEQAIRDAEKYEWCYAAVGIHPQYASQATDADIEEIRRLSAHPKVKAIGEIGLDFYYGKDNREEQIELFRKQIRLAKELGMPIMIHTRDANQLTFDILDEEGAFENKVQLHCFSGSKELALEYVKKGAMISLGGPITFKNGKKAAEVAASVPIEHLLSETDAPYLTPEPFRGRPNKTPYVEHVVRRMSVLKGMSFEDTAKQLLDNGCRFFDIDAE